LRRLIVNADDFGFTRDVNSGIVEAHQRGILTATTLMANGGAFDDAVRLARENPALDVGCHLVLVGGVSLVDRNRALPHTVADLVNAVWRRRLRPYDELKAQIDKTRADYERWLDSKYAAARGHVDALIDPLDTRRVLAFLLEVCAYSGARKHLALETL